MTELYKKYRPTKFEDLVGFKDKSIVQKVEDNTVPHAMLITGPSGCGKTTIARIFRRALKCSKHDFMEAAPRKVDDIRAINRQIHQAPMKGKCRIWLIDEAHKLTSDAQDEFLKTLEDTPSHVYFILTTTDPQKLKKTVRNRCMEIVVHPLSDKDALQLIDSVCDKENKNLLKEVADKIVDNSEGSPRKMLVYLDKVIGLEKKSEMLQAIVTATAEVQGIAIARALFNKSTKWNTMASILKETAGEEPEQIRWMVLGYAKAVMLGGGPLSGRAYNVIDIFGANFYDTKHAGLVSACYEIIVLAK